MATIVRMSDFDLPDDLIRLQRELDTARAELDAYVNTVSAERRAAYPDDEQIVQRQTWTEEQNQGLSRLRDAYMAAARAKWAHPGIVPGGKFEDALREAARAEPAAA